MGKSPKPKSHPSKVQNCYEGGKQKNRFCPKCGSGVFLASHRDREYCGKCHYTEFSGKKE